MAGRMKATEPGNGAAQGDTPAAPQAPDRDKLTDRQLAKALLANAFRARTGEVRRLAEAVLKKSPKKAKAKAKGKKPRSGKLARIPRPNK